MIEINKLTNDYKENLIDEIFSKVTKESSIKNEVNSIVNSELKLLSETLGTRSKEEMFIRLSNEFINKIRSSNMSTFGKVYLRDFINERFSNYSIRTIQRISKKILSLLLENNDIESSFSYKKIITWSQVKEFSSNDYGSYSILMSRNGYRSSRFYVYDYDTEKKFPVKKLIGSARKDSPEWFELAGEADEIETYSSKSKSRQGCRSTTGPMSYSKSRRFIAVNIFRLTDPEKTFNDIASELQSEFKGIVP